MKLEFIQELTEARMFRNEETLHGRTLTNIGEMAYYMFLMLEIMRTEDPKYAKEYATRTMAYNSFDGMYSGATDLHNLLSILNNPKDYVEEIKINARTSVPIFGIRRYVSDMRSGTYVMSKVRSLFLTLESDFKVNSSRARRLRRYVTEWTRRESSAKKFTVREVYEFSRSNSLYADITRHFKSKVYETRRFL